MPGRPHLRLRRRVADRRLARGPWLSGPARVGVLNGVLAITAAALFVLLVRPLEGLDAPFQVPWWALAAMFVFAEVFVLEVEVWKDSQTLSLNEVALVLGLFLAEPTDLVLGQLVGTVIALGALSRMPRAKLAFNVAMFSLCTVTAVLVFNGLARLGDPLGVAGWIAAFGATLSAELLALGSIILVMSLLEGRWQLNAFEEMLSFGSVLTLANTALALFLVTILRLDPKAAWLVLLPAAAVFVAYRAYTRERLRRERLRSLHDAMHRLGGSPELEAGVLALAAEARTVFRAEVTELTLMPPGESEPALRTTLGPGDERRSLVPVDLGGEERVLLRRLRRLPSLVLEAPRRRGTADPYLEARGFKDAMVTTLQGREGLMGTLTVADRTGDSATFSGDELIFLESFSSHVVVSLQNTHLEHSLAEQTELRRQLAHEATHDTLTGLANRTKLLRHLDEALTTRPGARPAIVFLGLDDFKTVNDTLGHAAGDDVLIEVGRRLAATAGPGDLTARVDGDGFAVLTMADHDGGAALEGLVGRLGAALRPPILLAGEEVRPEASVGVCVALPDDAPLDVLRNVDVAMHSAKEHERGGSVFFEPQMHAAVLKRHHLRADLQRAVERGEFVPFFQPLITLGSGRLEGTEALARWRHPERGLVFPAEFIPLAEATAMILPLGREMLRQACLQTRDWQRRLPAHRDLYVSVNLSGRQLADDGFLSDVQAILDESGLAPEHLVLEITETVAMHDTEATVARLEALHALGIRLAIDDFGTGYSSLAYLQRFPLDILKIAKEFIDGIVDGPEEEAFADTMIKLAGVLKLRVVAEGVELRDQADRLRAMGCDTGQGYLYARPSDRGAIEHLLADGLSLPYAA